MSSFCHRRDDMSHVRPSDRVARRAFTLVELLIVAALIAILAALIQPSIHGAIRHARRVKCMNNLKQMVHAFKCYINESRGVFPAHKQRGSGMSADGKEPDFWATDIYKYSPGHDVFFCPSILDTQYIAGTPWEWNFGPHRLGYGYNAYFLGLYSHNENIDLTPSLQGWMSTKRWLRLSEVKTPSMNILVADTNPIPPGNWWASSMWWPKSGAPWWEGVNAMRHLDEGGMVFNDGHAETRLSEEINPMSSPKETGDDFNIRFWDPQKRDNPDF
jgi:prepilin-type N-terminal cleavage/methylation domain-containing protein